MEAETESRLKVLVVEHDEEVLANLRELLADDYEVETCTATDRLQSRQTRLSFDVLILDWRLAVGGAVTPPPYAAHLEDTADVIVLSDQTDLQSAVEMLRQGAVDLLLKPIHPDVLRASLRRLAAIKEARRRAARLEGLAVARQSMATFCHEVKNELLAIGMGLNMLQEGPVRQDPSSVELISLLRDSQVNLLRLIDDLRTIATPPVLKHELCDVRQIWRDVWERLSLRRPEGLVILEDEHKQVDLSLSADPLRLGQVFRNLFENALDACGPTARIRIRCAHTVLNGVDAIEISVRDNGPGLAPEQRRKVFEPFYTSKGSGTGLGLSITRRIAEAHGGRIRVRDSGSGAEFIITLPRTSPGDLVASPTESSTDTATDRATKLGDEMFLEGQALAEVLPGQAN